MRDDTVWASDGSGRIFGTAEEWKPRGIMGQIHPRAGSEGGIKKKQTLTWEKTDVCLSLSQWGKYVKDAGADGRGWDIQMENELNEEKKNEAKI